MTILDKIVEHKIQEILELHRKFSAADFSSMENFGRDTISLKDSLDTKKPFSIIAEIKRSSPSAGEINKAFLPNEVAVEYENNGAAAISVLTDGKYFSGSIHDLACVRQAVSLPVLRKDFIIDYLQIYEAKAYGADAILLIAAILDKSKLEELHTIAETLGLECLVEIYDERETDKVNFDTMKLIGINNRDLKTMTIDLNHSIRLSKRISGNVTLVSESGVQSTDDIKKLLDADIHSALIGEYLMKSKRPGETLKALLDGIHD